MKNFSIDFIGVGAPKCGSSFISKIIQEHPDAIFSYTKEVQFFNDIGGLYSNYNNDRYSNGLSWYKKQFPKKEFGKIMGEFSTDYLYDHDAAIRIKKHFPDAKIIICLRNPVFKTYSLYNWYKNTTKEEKSHTFEDAINNKPEYLERGMYYEQVKRYFDLFDKNQIHIIIHEELKKSPEKIIKKLYEFLCINPEFIPPSLYKQVNESAKVRFKSLLKLLSFFDFLQRKNSDYLIYIIRKSGFYNALSRAYHKLNYVNYTYPPMKYETKRHLVEYFSNDVKKLETLIKQDLTDWKSF